MSDADVALAFRAYDGWNRGDLEAVLATASPELEFHAAGAFPDVTGVYLGHDGYTELWNTLRAAWTDITMDVRRVEQLGEGHLLVLFTFRGRGRGSGVQVSLDFANLWTIVDGVATRVHAFADWDSGLRAAWLLTGRAPEAGLE